VALLSKLEPVPLSAARLQEIAERTAKSRKCVRCGIRPAAGERGLAVCVACRSTTIRPDRIGTTSERGYGREHVRLRREWERVVRRGGVTCARPGCGRLIAPGEPWDLGHDDQDRTRYTGPEHAGCNRATAAHRKERELQASQSRRQSREW
jgi:hypothetical protein